MNAEQAKEYRKTLIQGYQNDVFLAERLKRIFFHIDNEYDRAIHNDFYDDILILIAGKRDELLNDIAKLITGYMR